MKIWLESGKKVEVELTNKIVARLYDEYGEYETSAIMSMETFAKTLFGEENL